MCGIAGLIYKVPEHTVKTGDAVIRMLDSLYRRGPDSTGVALFHPENQNGLYVGINYGKVGNGARIVNFLKDFSQVLKAEDRGHYVRALLSDAVQVNELAEALKAVDSDISVAAIGKSIEVLKSTGSAASLDTEFQVSTYDGPVAIGHTRMATESRVDISHSQPLSPQGAADLAIIHNGHITNYIKLRSYYESLGYNFITGNDSEVIAVYLTHKIANGATFREALEHSLSELDGSFTYVAVTKGAVGLVREPFGMKPMVIAETAEFVALASESLAIQDGFSPELDIWEPAAEEVLVWEL